MSRLGSNVSELSAQTEDGEDDEPDDSVIQSTCSEPNTVAATRSKTASMVDNGISLPTNVTKGIHVVYNEELGEEARSVCSRMLPILRAQCRGYQLRLHF